MQVGQMSAVRHLLGRLGPANAKGGWSVFSWSANLWVDGWTGSWTSRFSAGPQ